MRFDIFMKLVTLYCVYVLVFSFAVLYSVNAEGTTAANEEKQWIYDSPKSWDRQWARGDWAYLDIAPIERSRMAVIGVLIQSYVNNPNASVLDVGCGEGALADFLLPTQKPHYTGIDISKVAIHRAQKLRGSPMTFEVAIAHKYRPTKKFDVIVFSEVLYYVEFAKVLKQYEEYLTPNGIIVSSLYFQKKREMYKDIIEFSRSYFELLDNFELGGNTKKKINNHTPREWTTLRIDVFKSKKYSNSTVVSPLV